MSELNILEDHRPGLIGRIAELHALSYSRHWRCGSFFEAKVAAALSEFVSRCVSRFNFFAKFRETT
ncbi:MAG: hypothetical protein JXR89_02790 [Deltaproteobacteria bacterium]|nr:hypothetical protein [Deltaproteobacteria bacterium]